METEYDYGVYPAEGRHQRPKSGSARHYDSRIGRFLTIDPRSVRYSSVSPYNYAGNNPIIFFDPTGKDSIYFQDRATRPKDNGTPGTSYTASVYVWQNGHLVAIYVNGGSTYPNSKSRIDNSSAGKTVVEGEHKFNNQYGHGKGREKGLNLLNDKGERIVPAIGLDGKPAPATYVNVHEGASNLGGPRSRGSTACLTIDPAVADDFFNNFDWSGPSGTTGKSNGSVFVDRHNRIWIPIDRIEPKGFTFDEEE